MGKNRSAGSSTEAILVRSDLRESIHVVIPSVGAEVCAKVILIGRAVPLIAAAPGHQLDLGAAGAVEVRGLIGGGYFELFHALDRSGHHAGGSAAGVLRIVAPAARRVDAHGAIHIVRVVAAVQLIHVL